MESGDKPWWADDPQLAAVLRGVSEELEQASRKPITPDEPDAVVQDFWSGASMRELPEARDNLACASTRYDDAVRNARTVGFSWGEIDRVLGVSKQLLHRRFGRRA